MRIEVPNQGKARVRDEKGKLVQTEDEGSITVNLGEGPIEYPVKNAAIDVDDEAHIEAILRNVPGARKVEAPRAAPATAPASPETPARR